MIQEKNIFVDGCSIRYLEKGVGRPIIFISGWVGSADNFIPMLEDFPDNYRCLAIDLPGIGRSTPFPAQPHTVANYASFLEKFIKKLDLKDPVPVGISLGASLILDFCLTVDSKLSQVVIQSPLYRPITLDFNARFWLWFLYHSRSFVAFVLWAMRYRLFHYFIYYVAGDKNIHSLDFATISQYGAKSIPYCSIEALRESLQDVLNLDLTKHLHRIKTKILLIYGTQENLYKRHYLEELVGPVPSCQLVDVPGGTHFAMIQKHQEFIALITRFVLANH